MVKWKNIFINILKFFFGWGFLSKFGKLIVNLTIINNKAA